MFKGGAGVLNRVITLQSLPALDGPRNDIGELTSSPTTAIENIKAVYEPAGGREFPAFEKRHAETTARFRIRYRNDIDVQALPATHQVLYVEDWELSPPVTRTYDIRHAQIIGRREEIHIQVSEVR
jgi:head-tail adaptor